MFFARVPLEPPEVSASILGWGAINVSIKRKHVKVKNIKAYHKDGCTAVC